MTRRPELRDLLVPTLDVDRHLCPHPLGQASAIRPELSRVCEITTAQDSMNLPSTPTKAKQTETTQFLPMSLGVQVDGL